MNPKTIINNKIKVVTPFLLFLFILYCSLPVWASGQRESQHPPDSHQTEHSGSHQGVSKSAHPESESANTEHGKTDGAHKNGKIPIAYYLYWFILTVTFIMACFYCLWVYKNGKPADESIWLARFLIMLAITLYTVDQFPGLKRHFDQASHQFVDGYHEPATMGAVKLFYKLGLGVLLMIYGLIGRKH